MTIKTIGLLGGMSWESTAAYYRAINQATRKLLGGLHSAPIVMFSVDFARIEKMQHQGDWEGTARALCDAACGVQAAGADFLLICTNTMHKVAPQIEAAIDIPLLHIADATATALQRDGVRTAGLLGTAFTMEQDFYRRRLEANHGLRVLVPDSPDRQIVHRVIFDELCRGDIRGASQKEYLRIINTLADRGAQAVVLGCTEIAMLVSQGEAGVRLYDTTGIHARQAVQFALSQDS